MPRDFTRDYRLDQLNGDLLLKGQDRGWKEAI